MNDKIRSTAKKNCKTVYCTAIVFLFLAVSVVSMVSTAGVPHHFVTSIFNPGESWADTNEPPGVTSGGPSDYASFTHYLLNKDTTLAPILVSSQVSPTWEMNGIIYPSEEVRDVGSPWTWNFGDLWCGVAQVYTGINGYAEPQNYTAGGFYTLTPDNTNYHPGMMLSAIHTPEVLFNNGHNLTIGWFGQSTLQDDGQWIGNWEETGLLVDYLVQGYFGSGWVDLGAVANTPGESLTYRYNWGSQGEASGDHFFRIVPRYKGPNYNNDGTLFTPDATSEWVYAHLPDNTISSIQLRSTMGYQMIAVPTDEMGYVNTASRMADHMENETDMMVLRISTFDGLKWVDYFRRKADGSPMPQFHYTSFDLQSGYSYMVHLRPSDGATVFHWEAPWTAPTGPKNLTLHHGWNGVGVVYTDSWTTIGDVVDGLNITRAVVWTDAGWDSDDAQTLQEHPLTLQTFDAKANAHGFYVRTTTAYTWHQA